MVALESPGAEITENTDAFAVFMPNENIVGNPWQNYKISINELEDITGYDFLHNLPDELEEILENKNTLISGASLLATADIEPGSIISSNSSIGHNGVSEKSFIDVANVQYDIGQIGVNNVSINQVNSRQIGSRQIDFSQTSPSQVGTSQVGISQINTFHDSQEQKSFSEVSTSQVDILYESFLETQSTQISSSKIDSNHVHITHISPFEINASKNSDTQFKFIPEVRSSEITFSSSVSPEQFFNSHLHNSTPQIINELNNSATNIWSNLLQSEAQLDINFQITDLPTGQLAEATIAGFDSSGKPNAGTILIDHDANGVGWFIDETPLDNSEFTAQNSDSYFIANPESAANGKYDLLTTVLHELAHLYGFIDGYAGFEALKAEGRRQRAEGIIADQNVLIGDNFTATLDGEHLDQQAHPQDLLNTHLAPGIRCD